MEYYIDFKRSEVLTDAMPWMNPEDITLSEVSQLQRDKYPKISFMGGT